MHILHANRKTGNLATLLNLYSEKLIPKVKEWKGIKLNQRNQGIKNSHFSNLLLYVMHFNENF